MSINNKTKGNINTKSKVKETYCKSFFIFLWGGKSFGLVQDPEKTIKALLSPQAIFPIDSNIATAHYTLYTFYFYWGKRTLTI